MVGCIAKLQVPINKPKKITYRSLKRFDETNFKKEVNMIPFQISNIFSDEEYQYWVQIYSFTEILNEHTPIKVRSIKENHVFSKVFETIVAEQLRAYFENIFNNLLSAYNKMYGCEHLLVKLIDSWKYAIDNDKFVGTLLIDLLKAFDCIPH